MNRIIKAENVVFIANTQNEMCFARWLREECENMAITGEQFMKIVKEEFECERR